MIVKVTEVKQVAQVVTADIDEKALGDRNSAPEALVMDLARAKAAAIQSKLNNVRQKSLLITCDQVVVHNGQIMEKPVSEEEVSHLLSCAQPHP